MENILFLITCFILVCIYLNRNYFWYKYIEFILKYTKMNFTEKEALVDTYLEKVGKGQLFIYSNKTIYLRFCNLQLDLLPNTILYKYDEERRPLHANNFQQNQYFVYELFMSLEECTHYSVFNVKHFINLFEKNYKIHNNKEFSYTLNKMDCEFVFIARNKADTNSSFFYYTGTKMRKFKNRQVFMTAINQLLYKEIYSESGVFNSYSLESIALVNIYFQDNDVSKLTKQDLLNVLQFTTKKFK